MDELENPIGPIKEFVDKPFSCLYAIDQGLSSKALCHKHCSLAAFYTVWYILQLLNTSMRRTEKRRLSLAQITSRSQSQMRGKAGPYISWNKEMDAALAKALIEQMKQGNKVDGQWTRHAIPAVVHELNVTLELGLTKDNVKNRLKAWKRHYAIISDIKNQSGLMWDEGRKMVVITSENQKAWNDYVEV